MQCSQGPSEMVRSRRNDGSGGLRLKECGLGAHQTGWEVVRNDKFDSFYVASQDNDESHVMKVFASLC